MSDCPLVRLATNIKLLKQFEQTGQVTIHISDWIRFFEALGYISRERDPLEVYCAIIGDHLILSRAPFKRETNRPALLGNG
jgi:hypothetical protein